MSEPALNAPRAHPLRLLVVCALSAGAFSVALGVAAFLLRDVPLGDEASRAVAISPLVDGGAPAEAPLSEEVRRDAFERLRPLVASCMRESMARDPSTSERVRIKVNVRTGPMGGGLTDVRLPPASSPFLQGCLEREARAVDLPAAAPMQGAFEVVASADGRVELHETLRPFDEGR